MGFVERLDNGMFSCRCVCEGGNEKLGIFRRSFGAINHSKEWRRRLHRALKLKILLLSQGHRRLLCFNVLHVHRLLQIHSHGSVHIDS